MSFGTCSVCRTLIPLGQGSRCKRHRPKRVHALSSTQRGYDAEYRRNRRDLLADDDRCWLCGKHGANTADHEIPLSRGGTNHRTNLRPAHKSCNSSRGNRPA
ncbi:HNH endonuclease [Micromonospora andamanensis]|uniref:HNH endonuclease n=1 Tax=Micromonospora andamanensis TaxID=1287068 RepID=UPI0039B72C70